MTVEGETPHEGEERSTEEEKEESKTEEEADEKEKRESKTEEEADEKEKREKKTEDLRKNILDQADLAEEKLIVASESGLFHHIPPPRWWESPPDERGRVEFETRLVTSEYAKMEILILLQRSRELAHFGEERDVYKSARQLRTAEMLLHEAIRARGFWWRYRHLHRIGILLYQLVILAVIVGIALGVRFEMPAGWPVLFTAVLPRDPSIWTVPFAAAGFGAIGAILRSLYWLWWKISTVKFYDRFVVAHLSAPWIGAILGILVYLVLAGGTTTLTAGDSFPIQNEAVPYVLALAAGFSWEEAMTMLKGLAARLTDGRSSENREASGSSEASHSKRNAGGEKSA